MRGQVGEGALAAGMKYEGRLYDAVRLQCAQDPVGLDIRAGRASALNQRIRRLQGRCTGPGPTAAKRDLEENWRRTGGDLEENWRGLEEWRSEEL